MSEVLSPTGSLSLEANRKRANRDAVHRLLNAEPVLTGVARAVDVVPGMMPQTILTSGPPLAWNAYAGGQRRAILFAAIYEGLAKDEREADEALAAGQIHLASTQDHSCIGSVAGIYTASMPVFVVTDQMSHGTAFCNLYEGKSPQRLNYGSYNRDVESGLRWLETTLAPVLDACLRDRPIALKPLMARALRLGDELHSRNTAASMLFQRIITSALIDLDKTDLSPQVRDTLSYLEENEYAFLRIGMAAAKATADAAHGVPYSTVVTGMALNCREFGIRVSGLGDTWFRGEHPQLEGRYFEGFTAEDVEWIGGESCVTETIGLGGFAQACAPALQAYQGGSYATMTANNRAMYAITLAEHPEFKIPAFDFRGTPVGIDVCAVLEQQILPVIDGGLAGREGGQIGAGVLRPHLDCFKAAHDEWQRRYSAPASAAHPHNVD